MLVRTTEDQIEQTHKPPLAAVNENRGELRPVVRRSRVKPLQPDNPLLNL
jgi:hypothetical protein